MIYPHPLPYPGVRQKRRPAREAVKLSDLRKLPWKKILAWSLFVTLCLITLGAVVFTTTLLRLRGGLPTAMQIATYQPPIGTEIYSSDGVLLAKLHIENRRVVPLEKMPEALIAATLAVEDDRFYKHGAVDPKGLLRAAWSNLTSGNPVGQGGSTITMQLARNVPEFGLTREKRLGRKLREMMTAVRIEQVFAKDEILELYLNQIYYGSGAFGAEAASRTFFGKPCSKLTLSEAALLAGLPRRPEHYSPFVSRERAKDRRDVVLKRMLVTGRIDDARYRKALEEPLKLRKPSPTTRIYRAPYFVDWVVQDLIRNYGVDNVYGGMKIVTTLNWRMQSAAEKAVRRGLSYGAKQGALVTVDPHNGEVRAMVGGVDYKKDQFNAVTQGRRQPGSAFKPLVYAAALESGGLRLTDVMTDDPISAKSGREQWTVKNYSGGYSKQEVTIKDAIKYSINTIAVKAAAQVGPETVVQYAQAMGVSTPLAPYLSLALGSSAVKPIDLCGAYSHFATEGPRYDPIGIRSIRDRHGRALPVATPRSRRHDAPIQAGTIMEINVALREAMTSGTGAAANVVPNAFGKTGTTSDYRDAWFVGYTPELVTAVWVASPYRSKNSVLRYRPMPGGTGGRVAAPIWACFMRTAVSIQKKANQLRRVGPYAIYLPPPDPIVELTDERYAEADSAELKQIHRWLDSEATAPNTAGDGPIVERRGDLTIFRPRTRNSDWSLNRSDNSRFEEPGSSGQSTQGLIVTERNGMVRLCAESGLIATRSCPASYTEDPEAARIPSRHCSLHASPGDQ